jgi:AcrR family transcriptional regulator
MGKQGTGAKIDLEKMHQLVLKHGVPSPARDPSLIDRKQRQIVEGACKVMFEKGYHRTSIRDIAAACGMSIGQLYHYISTKDEILYLVHKHMQEIWYLHLAESGFDQIEDPLVRLEKAIRLSVEFIWRHKELFLFIYSESRYLDKRHLRLVLEIDDKNVVGFYRKLVADIPDLDMDEKAVDLAGNLISFLGVFLALRGWNLHKTTPRENIDFMVNFILRGLGLPPTD